MTLTSHLWVTNPGVDPQVVSRRWLIQNLDRLARRYIGHGVRGEDLVSLVLGGDLGGTLLEVTVRGHLYLLGWPMRASEVRR